MSRDSLLDFSMQRDSQRDSWDIRSHYLTVGEIVAHVLPVFTIAVLGANRYFLLAVFFVEVFVFLVFRTIKMAHYPGSTAQDVRACAVLLAPQFIGAALLATGFWVASMADQSRGEKILTALALGGSVIGIVASQISVFKTRTLKLLSFYKHLNQTYMIKGQPSKQLIGPVHGFVTCCLFEGYGLLYLYYILLRTVWPILVVVGGLTGIDGRGGDVLVALMLEVLRLGASAVWAAVVYANYGNSTPEEQERRFVEGRLLLYYGNVAEGGHRNIVRRPTEHQPSGARRQWTDSTGEFRLTAELVEVENDLVHLRRNDGRVVEVPVDRLGAADQNYLHSIGHPRLGRDVPEQAEPTAEQ